MAAGRILKKKPNITFDDQGHAAGWIMLVGECFRQQLDIKINSYVRTKTPQNSHLSDADFLAKIHYELDVIDHHKTKSADGVERWEITAWAQGPELSFDRGHFFTGRPKERAAKLVLQVLEATPTNSNTNDPGTARLLVGYAPNGPHQAATPAGIANITQRELLRFLKKANTPLPVGSDYDPTTGEIVRAYPVAELERGGLCVFKVEK